MTHLRGWPEISGIRHAHTRLWGQGGWRCMVSIRDSVRVLHPAPSRSGLSLLGVDVPPCLWRGPQVLPALYGLGGRKRVASSQLLSSFTPRAACQMLAVTVLDIVMARYQGGFCFFQRVLPCLCIWPGGGIAVPLFEAANKQMLQQRGQDAERWGNRHRAVRDHCLGRVGDVSQANALFIGRRVTRTQIDAGKGVGSFHQKLKEDDGQAKAIMLAGAVHG